VRRLGKAHGSEECGRCGIVEHGIGWRSGVPAVDDAGQAIVAGTDIDREIAIAFRVVGIQLVRRLRNFGKARPRAYHEGSGSEAVKTIDYGRSRSIGNVKDDEFASRQ